jgi:SAM-dependent methyltransferase
MPQPPWEERYATGDAPWDTGEPDEALMALVASGAVPAAGRVFEVGCGTGTNALWLARQGFDVTACDLAPLALERARAKLAAEGLGERCRFVELDFLYAPLPPGPFDLVFDRGVLHVFDEAAERSRFAERVASLLAPGRSWASLAGSTEGPPRDHGPPRRSLRDLADAVEPWLEVIEVRRVMFVANIPSPAAGWWFVARARDTPAQPSTRRG